MTHAEIEQMIIQDGYSIGVVSQMTNSELEQADKYTDYDEYTDFMRYICYKYDR